MPNPIDAERMQMLTGLLREAAKTKLARGGVLDAAEAAALGGDDTGGQPAMPAAAAVPPAAASAPGGMTQSQFGGATPGMDPRMMNPAQLAKLLRMQQMGQ